MKTTEFTELIRLKDACKFLPGSPSSNTIYRWSKVGVKGCKLETVLIGGRRYVHPDSIADFVESINRDQQPQINLDDTLRKLSLELET